MGSTGKRPTGEALAAALAERIGHRFADLSLAQTALTHSSAAGAKANNERMEFLGDRVLGLVVTDLLYRAYPDAPQGELAVRFSQLVSGDTCAAVAQEIGLDAMIRADAGLRAHGGRKSRNVLADALEALIAAVYLDAGIEAARAVILRHWRDRIDQVDADARDAKTALQEWAQARGEAPPAYIEITRDGPPHAPVFTIEARLEDGRSARASAGSKRAAEQESARVLLLQVDAS